MSRWLSSCCLHHPPIFLTIWKLWPRHIGMAYPYFDCVSLLFLGGAPVYLIPSGLEFFLHLETPW